MRQQTNSALSALSWTHGSGDVEAFSRPDGMQSDPIARAEDLVRSQEPTSGSAISPGLIALLGGRRVRQRHVDRVSTPLKAAGCPLVEALLEGEAAVLRRFPIWGRSHTPIRRPGAATQHEDLPSVRLVSRGRRLRRTPRARSSCSSILRDEE